MKTLTIQLPDTVEQYEHDIRRFIDAMVYKLDVHSSKGRWSDLDINKAISLMKGEIVELEEAAQIGNLIQILLESADVANFAMIAAAIAIERGNSHEEPAGQRPDVGS